MKTFFLFTLIPVILISQNIQFEDYFEDATMRVDYYHTGDADEEFITIDQIYKQGVWAGTITNLIDPFDLGKYLLKIYDDKSNTLIYSRGFATYFGEYQTTSAAKANIKKTYHESVLLPYPIHKIRLSIEVRNNKNHLTPLFKTKIDPADYHINQETPVRNDPVIKILDNGNAHQKVDLIILGDGYTVEEFEKFKSDLKKYTEIFFTIEPFQSNKSNFNITGVFSPSVESGTDEPTMGRYKNTVLNTTFNSLDSPRYLLTEDNKSLRNIAAQVPYDLAYIMVNVERYGGGGIYNTLALFTASEVKWNDYVFIHEFGHFFAALGDEYYNSSVAYDEFYPQGIEPAEANLTALLDPENVKWKELLSPGIGVPTDWDKEKFDNMYSQIEHLGKQRTALLDSLKNANAPEDEINGLTTLYADSIKSLKKQMDNFISNHPMRGKIGAFEGAGYSSQGLYRPTVNSIMHKFDEKDRSFYKVSEVQLQKMIDYYCK
ncbi:MAG: peptidase M64 [Calditrichaceae bacterium]|nr:peptidase M64 [Calditrichaceae bacterium]